MTRRHEHLRALDVADQLAAIEEIGARGDADSGELEALGDCLASQSKLVQRRAAEAFATLAGHGVPIERRLHACLRSADVRQRWGAAFALALVGALPPQALPVLIAALGADDGDQRWAAAEILVHKISDAGRLEALRELLHQGSALQRKMAAYCLRDLATRSAEIEAAVLARLQDPDAGVRLAAISALPRVACDVSTVSHQLIALLRQGDARCARAAAAALGVLSARSEEVLAALRRAAATTDPSLQRAARRSLAALQA